MMETGYRGNAPPALLPLPGARVVMLQREGGLANFALMGVWMGTIAFVSVVAGMLDGRVPEAVLPWVALPIVLCGLVGAFLVHRRIRTGGTRWRLHVTREQLVLERTSPPHALDLARVALRKTRYEYSFRGGRGAMPTVTIELDGGGTLVVSGPVGVGWQNLSEEETFAQMGVGPSPGASPERSRSADVRLDDAAAFQALQAAGERG